MLDSVLSMTLLGVFLSLSSFKSYFLYTYILFFSANDISSRSFLNSDIMKKDTHPSNYRLVVFKDLSNDESFIVRSCANTRDTISWEDGNEYPLVKLEISNKSHPFFTGKQQFVDTAGRIEKFNNKFSRFSKRKESTETPSQDAAE